MNLNKRIQQVANPPAPGKYQIQLGDRVFRIGDRVIQKRNNYDLDVYNGDIGTIREVHTEDITITVVYRTGQQTKSVIYQKDALSELDLAYAITIHKSQGSEFEAVIIPLFTQHFSMLFRNLVYTGLTRAKKIAVFVGNRKALSMAVRNNTMMVRQTALQELLEMK
jgi:exodeoxyribonuclease V alpha subunit